MTAAGLPGAGLEGAGLLGAVTRRFTADEMLVRAGRTTHVNVAAAGTLATPSLGSPLLDAACRAAGIRIGDRTARADLDGLLAAPDWDLALVLSPFKAAGRCDWLAPRAAATGAVDTLSGLRRGRRLQHQLPRLGGGGHPADGVRRPGADPGRRQRRHGAIGHLRGAPDVPAGADRGGRPITSRRGGPGRRARRQRVRARSWRLRAQPGRARDHRRRAGRRAPARRAAGRRPPAGYPGLRPHQPAVRAPAPCRSR